jgi:hypothetical protein
VQLLETATHATMRCMLLPLTLVLRQGQTPTAHATSYSADRSHSEACRDERFREADHGIPFSVQPERLRARSAGLREFDRVQGYFRGSGA